jgi:glycosyltransferase involved in cell wall biosynthesis
MNVRQPERLCLLLPAFNEAENLLEIIPEALGILDTAGFETLVIVVDDGSTDATVDVLTQLAAVDPRIRGVRLRRNSGKSAALRIGLKHVDGDVIVLMDADGQDDASSIPVLVDALRNGHDLATGRRALRQDRFVKRNTSKVYNTVTSRLTGVPGRDFNSGLKVMRRDVAESLDLYGELHRYIPVLAHWSGFRVTEVDVPHRPRRYGETKFGSSRFWRGFYDLLTVNFLIRYNARPLHLFGTIGGGLGLVGVILLAWMAVVKVSGDPIGSRPAFFTGIFLVIVAVQIVSIGLIAELVVHARHARLDGSPGETIGGGQTHSP